jgi:uncharacterized protein YceK
VPASKVYCGAQVDLFGFDLLCGDGGWSLLLIPLDIVDLLLSFALDTVFLPYTVTYELTHDKPKMEKPSPDTSKEPR